MILLFDIISSSNSIFFKVKSFSFFFNHLIVLTFLVIAYGINDGIWTYLLTTSYLTPVLCSIKERCNLMASFYLFTGQFNVFRILIRSSIFLMWITYLSASLFFLNKFWRSTHFYSRSSSDTILSLLTHALWVAFFFLNAKLRIRNFFSFLSVS